MSEVNKMLTPEDIRYLLSSFLAAIELDQVRVDALPSERFHSLYDDGMWRRWRRDHVEFIRKLLQSVDDIPSYILDELSQVAINHTPAVVGRMVLDFFADAVCGNCSEEEIETAGLFFARLISGLSGRSPRKPLYGIARARVTQWLPRTDPLRISKDPECLYGELTGLVN
jgi:hypothetical protein